MRDTGTSEYHLIQLTPLVSEVTGLNLAHHSRPPLLAGIELTARWEMLAVSTLIRYGYSMNWWERAQRQQHLCGLANLL